MAFSNDVHWASLTDALECFRDAALDMANDPAKLTNTREVERIDTIFENLFYKFWGSLAIARFGLDHDTKINYVLRQPTSAKGTIRPRAQLCEHIAPNRAIVCGQERAAGIEPASSSTQTLCRTVFVARMVKRSQHIVSSRVAEWGTNSHVRTRT